MTNVHLVELAGIEPASSIPFVLLHTAITHSANDCSLRCFNKRAIRWSVCPSQWLIPKNKVDSEQTTRLLKHPAIIFSARGKLKGHRRFNLSRLAKSHCQLLRVHFPALSPHWHCCLPA